MNRCLRCGASNRGKKQCYDCACGSCIIPVSARMLPTAKLLDKLGFQVAAAKDSIHAIYIDGTIEIIMIHVDFIREYDTRIFQDLPDGFTHTAYETLDRLRFSRISHADNIFPALTLDREARYALNAAIRRLYVWVEDMHTSGRWAVYMLGGLI